jgi:hypothetical protein
MRRLARRFNLARTTRPITMELLEKRVMLSATPAVVSNPIAPPPLPSQPTPLQGIVGTPNSLDPVLLNDAYGFDDLSFDIGGVISKADGAGETIAIVDAYGSPTIVQDAETFDAETYVSPGESEGATSGGISNYDAEGNFFLTIQKLQPTAGTITEDTADIQGWAKETSLDVEWAHAVAPGAHIILIEAASDSIQDLLDADVYAANLPGVVAVSDSWGGDPSEAIINGAAVSASTLDGYLVSPTGHVDNDGLLGGVVFLASSGDTATNQFPADSRNVLSVGGELQTIDLNGVLENYGPWAGSGGGDSSTGPVFHDPIVAADADPETGCWIFDSSPDPADGATIDGGWSIIGGTSFSCPVWAGLVSIVDQGLNVRGYGSMNTYQVEGLETYDNRGTTDEGDTGPELYTFSGGGYEILDGPENGYGILGITENDESTWNDLVQPVGVGSPLDTGFPLWGHKTNSTTVNATTTLTTTTPNPGVNVPDIDLTPDNSNTGWGWPNEFNGASPRGGFIQDMVGGPTGTVALYPDEPAGFIGQPVTVYSDTLDSLYFTQQPSNTQIGQPIDSNGLPELVVTAFSPTTNAVDQSFNGAVTIQILESGTLIGTTTVNAVDGSAVFANLSIDQEGTYEFLATSTSVNPASSNAFNITAGVGTHLVFAAQPTSFWQYSAMESSIVLNAEDQFNDFSYITNGPNVVATILTGPRGGILTGQTTATMVNGVVRLTGLGATLPGTYVLEIRFGGMPAVTTVPFAEVPIQVTEGRSINGSPLSQEAILFQELRNSQLYASQGPPDTALSQSVINADNNLLTLELVQPALTRSMAAATYGSKESVSPVFNSSASSASVEVELLDIVEAENKLLF